MATNTTINSNDSYISTGIVAGFVASVVSGIYIIITTLIALIPDFNVVVIQGSIFGLAQNIIAAWIMYFIIGMFIWGVIYAAAERRIPGSSQASKGLTYGIFIWLIVMIVVMPMGQAGFFASKFGLKAALYLLVLDLIFGEALALTYKAITKKP